MLREQRTPPTPAEQQAALRRAQERVRTWFEGKLADGDLEMARLFRDHRDAFVGRIATIYDRYLRDDPTLLRARSGPAAAELSRAINEQAAQLADELGLRMLDTSWRTLAQTPDVANRTIGKAADVEFAPLVPARDAVLGELTTRVVGGGTAYDRIFHITDGLRNDLFGTIRGGLLNGDPFDAVRDRVMTAFGVDRLPAPTKTAYGAVKLYRNEARRQWNLLMSELGDRSDPPSMQIWWATLDDRTTPGCAARHGKSINALGGETPPRHFNCRCTVAIMPLGTDLDAYLAEGDAWLQGEGWTRRRASAQEAWDPAQHPRDESGRFAFGGKSLAPFGRAAQGEFPEMSGPPEEHLYHTTNIDSLNDIATGGLQPHGPSFRGEQEVWPDGGKEPRTYFATRPGGALNFAEPDHILLRVPTEHARQKGLKAEFKDRDYYVSRKKIPSRGVEVLAHDGTWIPLAQVVGKESGWAWGHARLLPLREVTPESLERDFDGWYRAVRWRLLPTVVRRGLRKDEWYRKPGQAMSHGSYDFILMRSTDRRTVEVCSARGWIPLQPHNGRWIETHRGYVLDAPDSPPWGGQDQRAAVAVLEPDGRVWAIKPAGLPKWVLPGGHIEPGETYEDAAVREFTEETGIHIELVRKLGTLDTWWANTTVFLGRRSEHCGVETPSTPDEIDAVELIPVEQLDEKDRHFLADTLSVQESAFDPAEHPRAPAGGPEGGEFVSTGQTLRDIPGHIAKAVAAVPGRATHGHTATNAFIVTGDGSIYPYNKWSDIPEAERTELTTVHSHSADAGVADPTKEDFAPLNSRDIKSFLQTPAVRYDAIIMRDGRMEVLEKKGDPGLYTALGKKTKKLDDMLHRPYAERAEYYEKHKDDPGYTHYQQERELLRAFAKTYGLIYHEGLRWHRGQA